MSFALASLRCGEVEQDSPAIMDIAKLLLYAQKYYGTKTQGEEYRQKQIAEWVAKVIEQKDRLEDLLNSDEFDEINRFVEIEIKTCTGDL